MASQSSYSELMTIFL